jgi:pyridoxine 4-dehydrogenase
LRDRWPAGLDRITQFTNGWQVAKNYLACKRRLLSADLDVACLQVAINWCMCKGTVPIPGAKNVQQAEQNLGALGWKLSSGEVAELDKTAASLKGGMVQNIFQTK